MKNIGVSAPVAKSGSRRHSAASRRREAPAGHRRQRAELTLTAGEETPEMDQWIKDLAAGRRRFADRLADRQSLKIPSADPDYGDLGPAFPAWTGPGMGPILQPPKPEIPPSPRILERVMDRDVGWDAD